VHLGLSSLKNLNLKRRNLKERASEAVKNVKLAGVK
jgi:hypothetical protein